VPAVYREIRRSGYAAMNQILCRKRECTLCHLSAIKRGIRGCQRERTIRLELRVTLAGQFIRLHPKIAVGDNIPAQICFTGFQ